MCDTAGMRTAYRCRAYPDQQQQAVLTRTFGCIRVVWNRTLAARNARWQHQREGTSYAQAERLHGLDFRYGSRLAVRG